MNARRSLLTVLMLMSISACDAPGPRPPVAVNHVHETPTPSASVAASPAATPPIPVPTQQPQPTPAGPALTGRCHTQSLSVAFAASEGAAGTIVDSFRMANTGSAACSLYGFVGMQMLDAFGHPITTRVVRNGGIFSTQAGPSQFVLQPGAAASFQAAWSTVPHGSEGPCPDASQLQVTPPDEYDHRTVPVSGWNLAPCGRGEVDVTPIRAAGAGAA